MGEWGVGMPTALKLEAFAVIVRDAFGAVPYMVGSSTKTTAWRDVDVRVILADDEYKRWGFGPPGRPQEEPRWVAMVLAFSALGREMTGLPIDFQIQQQTLANEEYPDQPRNALGIRREAGESRRRARAAEPTDADVDALVSVFWETHRTAPIREGLDASRAAIRAVLAASRNGVATNPAPDPETRNAPVGAGASQLHASPTLTEGSA